MPKIQAKVFFHLPLGELGVPKGHKASRRERHFVELAVQLVKAEGDGAILFALLVAWPVFIPSLLRFRAIVYSAAGSSGGIPLLPHLP